MTSHPSPTSSHHHSAMHPQTESSTGSLRKPTRKERAAQQRAERREKVEGSYSYRLVQIVAKWMDRYMLDPIIGFLFPGYGDAITSLFVVPYLYVSIFKVRSLPLTLAVIYNVLLDVLLGLIPFLVGAIFDCFNRAYTKNARLVIGFVEGRKDVIEEVNRKALWMALLIVLLCLLIYGLVMFISYLASLLGDFWGWLCGLF